MRSAALLVAALFAAAHAHATALVLVREGGTVCITADSLRLTGDRNSTVPERKRSQACKLTHARGLVLSGAGITKNDAVGLDVHATLKAAVLAQEQEDGIWEAARGRAIAELKIRVHEHVHGKPAKLLSLHEDRDPSELSPIAKAFIIGFQNGQTFFEAVEFLSGPGANITAVIYRCPGAGCPSGENYILAGIGESIPADLSIDSFKKAGLDVLARRLVDDAALNDPIEVDGPVDWWCIDSSGQARGGIKPGCDQGPGRDRGAGDGAERSPQHTQTRPPRPSN